MSRERPPGAEIGEDEAGEHRHQVPVPALSEALGVLVFIVVLALLILAIPGLRHAAGDAISGDTDALREELHGVAGVFTLFVLALLHTVVFYPAEILDTAAGYVWGFGPGLALIMAAWLLNAWAAWEIGRRAARPLLYRLFGHERFIRYEDMVERGGITLLLAIRVIPIIPFSLFTMVIGAARVPLRRVLWTTAVGYLPITALFVYLGTQLEKLSPTDPMLIGGAIVLLVAVIVAHRIRAYFDSRLRRRPRPWPHQARVASSRLRAIQTETTSSIAERSAPVSVS